MIDATEEYHPKLSKFIKMYGSMDEASFLDVFTHPFLFFELSLRARPPKYMDRYAELSEAEKATVTDVNPAEESAELFVAPLVKSERNPVRDNVFIGRKPWNDVVIPHPNVSKMHGYIKAADSGYVYQDVGSRAGTLVREEAVMPNMPIPLASKDTLSFAECVPARFFLPADFFEFMQLFARS